MMGIWLLHTSQRRSRVQRELYIGMKFIEEDDDDDDDDVVIDDDYDDDDDGDDDDDVNHDCDCCEDYDDDDDDVKCHNNSDVGGCLGDGGDNECSVL